MKIDLSGKTALVTGSTSGTGHAIVKGLAASGACVEEIADVVSSQEVSATNGAAALRADGGITQTIA